MTYDILVAGSGVMGRGIAASFAAGGARTAVLSRNPDALGDLPAGVEALGDLPDAPPSLIVETIPEKADLKRDLYARLEARWQDDAPVIGSNTSSLPLQDLADGLTRPERFCGIHYFQPADIAPVVELARVRQSSEETIARAADWLGRAGKQVLLLNEPIDGLLINRLQHAILHEAYHLIERGICTAADVDKAAKELLGPRMSVTGLIEQKDLSGLDTHALAQAELVPRLHHGSEPSTIVQTAYRENRLGTKTGTGFYDWREQDVAAYRAATGGLLTAINDMLAAGRPVAPPLADGAKEADGS